MQINRSSSIREETTSGVGRTKTLRKKVQSGSTAGFRCTMPVMVTTLEQPTKRPPIPGPKGHWLKGNLTEFAADRLGFLTRIAREYGDVVAIRFLHRKILIVNHPDLVEEVLVTRNRSFIKHFALRMAKPTLGEGLLTSEGDFWRRQRPVTLE
jgi:hypothetical protein